MRLMKALRQLKESIVFKLMVVFIILITLLETVFFYFFLTSSKDIVINKATTLTMKSLDSTSESIIRLFDLMINSSKHINMDKEVINILNNEETTDPYNKVFAARTVDNVFLSVLTAFSSYNVYCTLLGENKEIYTSYDRRRDFDKKRLYDAYSNYVVKNSYVWIPSDDIEIPLPPEKQSVSGKRLTVVSPIQEYPSSSPLGLCVISVEHNDFIELLSAPISSNMSSICLADENNNPIITIGDNEMIGYFLSNHSISKSYGSFTEKFNDNDYLINYKNINLLSWKIVEIIPKSLLLTELNLLQKNLYIFTFATVCILLAIVIVVSFYITRPIRDLSKVMQKVESGELNVKIKVKSKDEIGILCRNFNKMIDQINNLFEQLKEDQIKQHELEIESLQLQIRPHFLLNTLNSIRWIAVMSQANSVSNMIGALSNLLRTSISITEKYITLAQEIQNVKDYLYIQKIRYNGAFTTDFFINDDILQCKVIKMILQPIVENSLIHGLDKTSVYSKITITGQRVDNNIIILVKDNGKGMSAEKVNEIILEMDNKTKTKSGIGLRNINQRLKMTFGDKYGLNIICEQNKGTVVEIKMPVIPVIGEKEVDEC